jgi:nucleotide-binding universal stress UspA family protein
MSGIVVGVDGSESSRLALDWAIGEAAVHAAPLRVVAVQSEAIDVWGLAPVRMPVDENEREQVRAAAEAMVDKALAQAGDKRPPSVAVEAISGVPADVLVDISSGADMLVLGSREAGGLGRLGSVSLQVAHHVRCPLIIIPAHKES